MDDSGPPVVHHGTDLPLTASTPRATAIPAVDTQSTQAYHQFIPGGSQHLYPMITVDGSFEAAQADNGPTLHNQTSIELKKYLKEAAEKCQAEVNYYDGCHQSTNTSPTPQEEAYPDEDQLNNSNTTEHKQPFTPESHQQDTGNFPTDPQDHYQKQGDYQDDLTHITDDHFEVKLIARLLNQIYVIPLPILPPRYDGAPPDEFHYSQPSTSTGGTRPSAPTFPEHLHSLLTHP